MADRFFSGAKVAWEKQGEEIWGEMEGRMKEEDRSGKPFLHLVPGRQWMALAATLALLLAIGLFMRYYSVETHCPQATHTVLNFPDGSVAEINAETTLKYHPYWWFVARSVQLEGEAYFQVKKGRPFRVESVLATTEVLGTTFNVYARGKEYHVTCHSGSVQVRSAITGKEQVLAKDERADLDPAGALSVTVIKGSSPEPGWVNRMITFASTPLGLVLEEIERQYGIVIEAPDVRQQVYSGKFSLDQPVEEVLSLICLPFDLEYDHKTGKTYRIHPALRE